MSTPHERWFRKKKWRWPLIIGFTVVLAVILIGVNAFLRVAVFDEPIGGPETYIGPLIIGFGSAFAAGVAQPWGERRRARRDQNKP